MGLEPTGAVCCVEKSLSLKQQVGSTRMACMAMWAMTSRTTQRVHVMRCDDKQPHKSPPSNRATATIDHPNLGFQQYNELNERNSSKYLLLYSIGVSLSNSYCKHYPAFSHGPPPPSRQRRWRPRQQSGRRQQCWQCPGKGQGADPDRRQGDSRGRRGS